VVGIRPVAGEDAEFVGFGFQTGEGGGDSVTRADGSLELEAAKLGHGISPDFEWLGGICGVYEHAFERQEINGPARDGNRFRLAGIGRVNLHGHGIAARKTIEVQRNGRGEEI